MSYHFDPVQIRFLGKTYNVQPVATRYTDGNLAVQVLCSDGPFGTLSTNIDGVELAPDEFCVKTWSENDPWAMNLLSQCPQFEDTGRRFHSGFVSGPIYRMLQVVG
jgi:hypothetical protein